MICSYQLPAQPDMTASTTAKPEQNTSRSCRHCHPAIGYPTKARLTQKRLKIRLQLAQSDDVPPQRCAAGSLLGADPKHVTIRRVPASSNFAMMKRHRDAHRGVAARGMFNDGIELALRRILASPHFLVRAEQAAPKGTTAAYRISDLDVPPPVFVSSCGPAFLMTNSSLLRASKLHTPAVLEQQVARCLARSV